MKLFPEPFRAIRAFTLLLGGLVPLFHSVGAAVTSANASSSPIAQNSVPRQTEVRCTERIEKLPLAGKAAKPYLDAADCLRRSDSSGARTAAHENSHVKPGTGLDRADSTLKARLPGDPGWYLTQLDQFRLNNDGSSVLNMGYLAELKHPGDRIIFQVLAEAYRQVPDPIRAGLAYLHLVSLDATQSKQIQYQMENLIRANASELNAAHWLDSLTVLFVHTQGSTAEVMESLCWENRDYPCAYKNLCSQLSLQQVNPAVTLDRVNRFQTLGYFDYAAGLLDKISWRNLSPPWTSMARALYLQNRYFLKDWKAIVDSSATPPGHGPAQPLEEESFILATALLKLGKPEPALATLKGLETKSTLPPWNFRGRLLKAQALMSLKKTKEANETLTALKTDPDRQEGTGPILFWQGCLAIDQNQFATAESLLVLASAYTGTEEAQRALEYRFYMLQDTGKDRPPFFHGLSESPHSVAERLQSLEKVTVASALWPFARLEKAQILVQIGRLDSAEAVLEDASHRSPDRLAGLQAEAKAAFLMEKSPGGKQAALARYEDLLIKYQQGVIPEFSRGRIKALK